MIGDHRRGLEHQEQLALLGEAQRMVEAAGAMLLVVPIHMQELPEPYTQLFQEHRILYLDPAKVFALEQDRRNILAGYLNAQGNARFADLLFEVLVPYVSSAQLAPNRSS